MKRKLSSVKIDHAYHHGDLRAALLRAAEAILAERGVEGFSLRETARRAGVSPAATKHHFRDVRALFTAIATTSFGDLADQLEKASADETQSRLARIHRQGAAYVEFAIAHPARFDLMWRVVLLDVENEQFQQAAGRAFAALDRLVRGVKAPKLKKGDRGMAPTIACWSMAHGFAQLAIDGTFGTGSDAARRALRALLPAVLEHLSP
jgi:AcrR family transcriptional regulator